MQTLMVCTLCKTAYNILKHAGLICCVGCGDLLTLEGGGGRGEVQEIESPDFRSPEVGISVIGAIP